MPPAVSDEESDFDIPDAIPAKAKAPAPAKDEEEDDDDEEVDEDEFVVESVLSHKVVKGQIHYQIKWAGWEDPTDLTWEPSENVQNAKDALNAYHTKIGGTPEPPVSEKRKGKRNASEAFDSPIPSKKGKGRKSDANGDSEEFKPPIGSWEDSISRVAAILEEEEEPIGLKKSVKDTTVLLGLLEWNNGKKTQHKMSILRQKCPQRLLDYYENHLVFKGDPDYVSELAS